MQALADDLRTFARENEEHLPSPPDVVFSETNWSSSQSQGSPPLNSEAPCPMTSSGMANILNGNAARIAAAL